MSTFTIPFPEYDIADILIKEFHKKDNFSVAIPFSRQQKFYDLLLLNGKTKKHIAIQVKSSRTYIGGEKDEYQYYSWLNHFDIKDNYSDYYFIYMTYPLLDKETFKPRAKWERKILVFNNSEMIEILKNVKTKSGKQEHFFSFAFNVTDNKIDGARGFANMSKRDFSKNLLEYKLEEIKKSLV